MAVLPMYFLSLCVSLSLPSTVLNKWELVPNWWCCLLRERLCSPTVTRGVKRGVKRVRQEYVEVLEGDQRVAHRGWERKG